MNTPSNAGKELLPCPFCGGLPLVNYERIVCEDCRIGSEPEQPGCSILSLTERWNRRATPPAQSQEGETPESDELYTGRHPAWIDSYNLACKLERQRNAAQRENDRLRSEVAGLNADKERLDWLDGDRDRAAQTVDTSRLVREAIDTARAATEEGKRG